MHLDDIAEIGKGWCLQQDFTGYNNFDKKVRSITISIFQILNISSDYEYYFVDSYYRYIIIISIIISLLMSPLPGQKPSLWNTHKENGP
jgi:hypothetical protein